MSEGSTWCVYMLLCEGGSLYTGISPDVERRFKAHSSGKGAAYTRIHKPLAILAAEPIGSYSLALRREAQLKQQKKQAKLAWVQDPASLKKPAEDADWLNKKAKKVKKKKAPK